MQSTKIIKATTSNLLELQKISRITFEEAFGKQNTVEDMQKYLNNKFSNQQLLSELNNKESEFYLAKVNNQVVGYLKLNFGQAQTEIKDKAGIEIERIYILNSHIGQGIGQALFNHCLNLSNKMKVNYIWLGVWEKNERAINFYERNGFTQFDTHLFVLGDDEQTDVLMRLNLN